MIPQKFFVTWRTRSVLDLDHPMIERGIRSLTRLNPEWELEFSEDEEVNEYLRKSLDEVDYRLLADRHIVEKTDVWRLVKLYLEGGCYVDLDRLHDTPLPDLSSTMCVLPTCKDHDFSQDFMLSAPGNPLYLRTLELNLTRRRQGHTSVYFLGSQTFMHAITTELLGRPVDVNPGREVFVEIRKALSDVPNLMTVTECPPIRTLTFRNEAGITADEHEAMKRDLYKVSGIRHWTNEW